MAIAQVRGCPILICKALTGNIAENPAIPTSFSTSVSLVHQIRTAASSSSLNSSRTVRFIKLIDPCTIILTTSPRRQRSPIHMGQIETISMAASHILCDRHHSCSRLPPRAQVHTSRPQGRKPTRYCKRTPEDYGLWFRSHRSPQRGGVTSAHLLWYRRVHVSRNSSRQRI
jgi:hypothetical protein